MNNPITPSGPVQPIEAAEPVERTYRSEEPEPEPVPLRTRWLRVAFLLVLFCAEALIYKLLFHAGYGHTGAMFIGVPSLLAVLLCFAPRTKTFTGSVLRGITFALLVVAPLLGEGYLCILFAAPLFYVIGLIVSSVVEYARNKRAGTLTCIALVLIPFSLEGVLPQLTFNRFQDVSITQTVAAPSASVESALSHSPRIGQPLPRFLRIGFPRPIEAHGDGLAPGSLRSIHFTGAEGDPPGDLVMRVTESSPGHARFETIADSSKLTQWVLWQSSDVTWKPIDATHTAVTWRIGFNRQLDPYWYFTPWERVAVRQAAKYLIAANATPAGQP